MIYVTAGEKRVKLNSSHITIKPWHELWLLADLALICDTHTKNKKQKQNNGRRIIEEKKNEIK